jgi:hypothetical protein
MTISTIFVDSTSLEALRDGGLNNVAAKLGDLGHPDAAKAVSKAAITVSEPH